MTAIFLSIILLFAFTPLGFINLGIISATLIHVPVIIGAVVLGPRYGAFLGLSFGLISMFNATVNPVPMSFVFSPFIPVIGTNQGSLWAIVIAIIPRILVGIVPYYAFQLMKKSLPKLKEPISLFISGVIGSLTNTILVMNLIYLLFNQGYSQIQSGALGSSLYKIVLAVIVTNGIPEAIVAGIATSAVTAVLLKLTHRSRN
ncbi:ECF transporter S component [Vagococcus vulneris]|uniref:ECF transporter S component n=1 Tax=Vagococcus vulneris TaxID=1977869 RepID=A0A429ZYG5_9ENTE|nr:ECF transporter S component [Vagococcus vulneris]RST98995.1 ECF transporter S component [Vagococcus vulneris]